MGEIEQTSKGISQNPEKVEQSREEMAQSHGEIGQGCKGISQNPEKAEQRGNGLEPWGNRTGL